MQVSVVDIILKLSHTESSVEYPLFSYLRSMKNIMQHIVPRKQPQRKVQSSSEVSVCTVSATSQKPTTSFHILNSALTYTFSAKERDPETGLSYFGSRYYSSDLSIWLSVDPMSDKYPSLSPYVYCANNPVRLVDPNGEEVWIHDDEAGSAAIAYYQELDKWASSEKTNLSLGTDSYLNTSFDRECSDLSDEAQNFLHAVYNPNITVDILATSNDYRDNGYAFSCILEWPEWSLFQIR